jgi:prolyl-tRNA synthetase
VQAATSHCLGQNFAHMFDITFEDQEGKTQHAWQNSWGLSTRSLGVMVMVHGDDKGLVLPPKVAPVQVIIVPIYFKDAKNIEKDMEIRILAIVDQLKAAGIRAEADLRSTYNPGWKFNHWELKGVPIRLELGPKDYKAKQVTLARRDNGSKTPVPWSELLRTCVAELENIHQSMYDKAKAAANPLIFECNAWDEFLVALQKGGRGMCPSCDETECEMAIRERSGAEAEATASGQTGGAKSLCKPLVQPAKKPGKCFQCGKPAKVWTLFGRSY